MGILNHLQGGEAGIVPRAVGQIFEQDIDGGGGSSSGNRRAFVGGFAAAANGR